MLDICYNQRVVTSHGCDQDRRLIEERSLLTQRDGERHLDEETQEQQMKYMSWARAYVLPEAAKRIKELNAEGRSSR
jgi:hypothetical protein